MNGQASGVVTIIPIKPLSGAKSRLHPHLDQAGRERLVINMLQGVIRAAATDEVWVVGADDPAVEGLAKRRGALWRREEGTNVNQSLEIAFRRVWDAGKVPLYLPGDLPFVQRRDLEELMTAASDMKNAVLAPAHRSGGTNAILLPRPSEFRPLLGPGSFRRHLDQAASLGLDVAIYSSPGLALDLDTWEDVRAYQALEAGLLERLTRGDPRDV